MYSMRIDSAERFAYTFMYSNTQFRTKNVSIITFRFIILGTVTLKNSKYLMHVKRAYVLLVPIPPHCQLPRWRERFASENTPALAGCRNTLKESGMSLLSSKRQ